MVLLCPKCHSNQLKAIENGVTNPLLEKGVQLFAGTIKSNKILLICCSCSHTFRPGESEIGKTTLRSPSDIQMEDIDTLILQTIKEKGILSTIKTYKDLTGVTLGAAKMKVETIAKENGIETKMKTPIGCYIIIILIALLCLTVVLGMIKTFK